MRKGLTRYGDEGFSLFLRKAFIKAMGYSDDALARPVVGIADTGSDYNACHANVPRLVEAVKRGVMLAGGLPMAFPTISLHESFSHPTSMFLRNLMAMDTEEMVRAQPMDAVVLIGGCDKTIPAQLMAAASADVPALVLPTGPMMTGHYRGERLGACTDCRRFWGMYRAGELDDAEIEDVNDRLAPTAGTCMVMGTASTMACMTEALGMMLPGGATIPAVHADRERFAERTGRRAVGIAAEDLRPQRIMTSDAFHNALVTLQAIGGSTNALVHITAVAGRLGIGIDLDEFDSIGRRVPVLVDLKPSGDHYMEHLHDAGGLNAVLRELRAELRTGAPTVSGRTLDENIEIGDRVPEQTVVRTRSDPIHASGGWRCSGATSPRAGRSSSTPPPRRTCWGTPEARWCSIRSPTSRRASTTRISTSRRKMSSYSEGRDRRARRACRRRATSRSRRNSRRAAPRTWCGSPTRA